MTVSHSQLLQVVADCDRKEDWRQDGATSMADWLVARLGIAHRTARAWVRVAHSLQTLPAMDAAFAEGRFSFEQLAPATRLATPQTDAAVAEQAPGCTAAQLELSSRRSRPVSTEEANQAHRRRFFRLRPSTDDRFTSVSGRLADAEAAVVERAIVAVAQAPRPTPSPGSTTTSSPAVPTPWSSWRRRRPPLRPRPTRPAW
jgi:hypothetical protein